MPPGDEVACAALSHDALLQLLCPLKTLAGVSP